MTALAHTMNTAVSATDGDLAPELYTPVPELLPEGTTNPALAEAIAKVVGLLGEYRDQAVVHNRADLQGGSEFQAADDRWQAFLSTVRDACDEITEVPAQSFAELHQQISAYLRAKGVQCLRAWRDLTVDEAIKAIEDGGPDDAVFGVVTKTVAEALPRLLRKPGLSPAVAQALADFGAAHEAHDAAITAYSAVEQRVFNGEITEEDPAHVAADAAQGEACDEDCAAWARLIETPALTEADVFAKMVTYLQKQGVRADALAPVYPDRAQIDLSAAHAHLQADVERVQVQVPNPARAAWDAAMARHRKAKADHDASGAENAQHTQSVYEQWPVEIRVPSLHYGVHVRWHRGEIVHQDLLLTAEEKERFAPIADAWEARRDELLAANDPDPKGERSDATYDAYIDAMYDLFQAPAPDLQAVVYKLALEAKESDDARFGYDDLGRVAFLLDSAWDERNRVLTHLDILRLAGVDHPMLHMGDFSPRAWVRAYEELGGRVSCPEPDEVWIIPSGERHPNMRDRRARLALEAELEATPWKYRAVFLHAEERRNSGGDPIFDSAGRFGDDDRRGSHKGVPVKPITAAMVVRFVTKDGQPAPVVLHHVQGQWKGF